MVFFFSILLNISVKNFADDFIGSQMYFQKKLLPILWTQRNVYSQKSSKYCFMINYCYVIFFINMRTYENMDHSWQVSI